MATGPNRLHRSYLRGTTMPSYRLDRTLMAPFTRELRRLGKQHNAFGGNDDLENALYKAADILDDYSQLAEIVENLLDLLEKQPGNSHADH